MAASMAPQPVAAVAADNGTAPPPWTLTLGFERAAAATHATALAEARPLPRASARAAAVAGTAGGGATAAVAASMASPRPVASGLYCWHVRVAEAAEAAASGSAPSIVVGVGARGMALGARLGEVRNDDMSHKDLVSQLAVTVVMRLGKLLPPLVLRPPPGAITAGAGGGPDGADDAAAALTGVGWAAGVVTAHGRSAAFGPKRALRAGDIVGVRLDVTLGTLSFEVGRSGLFSRFRSVGQSASGPVCRRLLGLSVARCSGGESVDRSVFCLHHVASQRDDKAPAHRRRTTRRAHIYETER